MNTYSFNIRMADRHYHWHSVGVLAADVLVADAAGYHSGDPAAFIILILRDFKIRKIVG